MPSAFFVTFLYTTDDILNNENENSVQHNYLFIIVPDGHLLDIIA